jgi:hypothetical protein
LVRSPVARTGSDLLLPKPVAIRRLRPFELASEDLAWWPALVLATVNQRSFSWPEGPSGRRSGVGHSWKPHFYWY